MQVAKHQICFSMFFPISLLSPLSDYPLANFHLAAASLDYDGSHHEDTVKVHHGHFLPLSFLWLRLEPAPAPQLLPLESRCSLSAACREHQSLQEGRCSEDPAVQEGRCSGDPAVQDEGAQKTLLCTAALTLTSCRAQFRDALGGFVVRVFGGHHLVPLAALLVQHVRDLQCSLSLCSQVQILLGKVGPQLPDFKLEGKTASQTDVMRAWPEVSMLQMGTCDSFYH